MVIWIKTFIMPKYLYTFGISKDEIFHNHMVKQKKWEEALEFDL